MSNRAKKIIDSWGVPFLLITLPLYLFRFSFFGIPFTLLEVLFWVVFVSWFTENFRSIKEGAKSRFKSKFEIRNSKFIAYPFTFFITLFAVASFIGLAIAGFSNSALGIYKAYFIEAILFYILVFNYYKDQQKKERVFFSLFFSALVVSLYAIYQKIFGIYWSGSLIEQRVTGFFEYPNALGLYLGPISVLAFFYFIRLLNKGERKRSAFVSLIFLVSVFSIYFARNEAALIAVLVSIFAGGIFVSRKLALVFIGLALLFSMMIASNNRLLEFSLDKLFLRDFSGEVRKQQWRETAEMFSGQGNYISGCGLSSYQACVADYHQEGIFFNYDRDPRFRNELVWGPPEYKTDHWRPVEIYLYPHNIFLNFWTETSLVGLISVVGLIGQFFYFGFVMLRNNLFKSQSSRVLIIGLMAVMLEILIHGMVDVPYFKNDLSFLWWTFFAIMGVEWAGYSHRKEKGDDR